MTNQTESNYPEIMYSIKELVIPHFTLNSDIPTIISYFEKYDIAKIENVVYVPPKSRGSIFGSTIIYISRWCDNIVASNFYENLVAKKCKIVYNDPYYWDVMFHCDYVELCSEYSKYYENEEVKPTLYSVEDENALVKDEDTNDNDDTNEEENRMWGDLPTKDDVSESGSSYYDESEDDDVENDPDYEYEEEDTNEDAKFEYLYPIVKRIKYTIQTRSRKNKEKIRTEQVTLKENLVLSDVQIRKNKNFAHANKRKEFKNDWSRRLRTKLTSSGY